MGSPSGSWPVCSAWARSSARLGARQSKYLTYESGVDPVGTGWTQAEIRYYIFALLFVMFDVEAVFIFPWATRLEAYGAFGARRDDRSSSSSWPSGLLYAWRKGVLRWT